jgi:phytoene dehydrogenase-like protein
LRSAPALIRQSSLRIGDVLGTVRDPGLREFCGNIVHFGDGSEPLATITLPLAFAHRRLTGIPREGWLDFARAAERRFLELGGEIRYRSRVSSLVVSGAAVRGVRLADGTEIDADRVLSAADGRFTRAVLLGEAPAAADSRFPAARLSDQPVQVNFGVAQDWSAGDSSLTIPLPDAPGVAGRPQRRITVHRRLSPASAPAGKSSLTVFLESEYGFWADLAADRRAYEAEKERCAEVVSDALERERPGFRAALEITDVSTPLTRERFTGNRHGAMQAMRPDPRIAAALLRGSPRYRCGGISGMYQAGQWVEPWGGITTAALSGRNAVRALCRDDGVAFR